MYNSQENLIQEISALELRQKVEQDGSATEKNLHQDRAVSDPPSQARAATGEIVDPENHETSDLHESKKEEREDREQIVREGVSEGEEEEGEILGEDEDEFMESPPPIPPRNYLEDKSPTDSSKNALPEMFEAKDIM